MKIAKATPFDGTPQIMMPSIYGASTGKEIMYRIPVIGNRPIEITVDGLQQGLNFKDGKIKGVINCDCDFTVKITAKNKLGYDEKVVTIKIRPDHTLLTPLMGYTTWNAYDSEVSQEIVETTARDLAEKGFLDYGYNYFNTDSGWQSVYGGEFDAIMPNEKFPDMETMCSKLHDLGFKCGIYSTPMLTAWGCPAEFKEIPGCTVGEPDILNTTQNGGIGVIHKERNNVLQWEKWGFDYLKYDWCPSDPPTADLMKKELLKSKRDFSFCVTIAASKFYGKYWSQYCNSWRDAQDSKDNWEVICKLFDTVETWNEYVHVGHFYDLDMLEIGAMYMNNGMNRLTTNEAIFAYTMRAFFMSPLQLSCQLDKLTDTEFDIVCNPGIIKIHQDSLCEYPSLLFSDDRVRVYKRNLENGDEAIAVFNISDQDAAGRVALNCDKTVTDVWANELVDIASFLSYNVEAHSAKVYRMRPYSSI